MQLPAVRALIKSYSIKELKAAEQALSKDDSPAIEVGGADCGEQLTHVLGAIWILEKVAAGDMSESEALRAFAARVRDSIS